MSRQRVRRASVALDQVRGGLLARLRHRGRGSRGHRPLLRFLQRQALAPGARLPDSGGVLPRFSEGGGLISIAVHSPAHNLRVSPLALPPRSLAFTSCSLRATATMDANETTTTIFVYY